MTYDAVLVARRGLGIDEMRLISPQFGAAVRWAVFAEKLTDGIGESRGNAEMAMPDGLTGQQRTDFMGRRTKIREHLKQLDAVLYPEDDDGV